MSICYLKKINDPIHVFCRIIHNFYCYITENEKRTSLDKYETCNTLTIHSSALRVMAVSSLLSPSLSPLSFPVSSLLSPSLSLLSSLLHCLFSPLSFTVSSLLSPSLSPLSSLLHCLLFPLSFTVSSLLSPSLSPLSSLLQCLLSLSFSGSSLL